MATKKKAVGAKAAKTETKKSGKKELTAEEKKKKYRDKYHETGEQLGYYYQNREKILRANVLKKLAATKQFPLKRTIEKYGITQEEIGACLTVK